MDIVEAICNRVKSTIYVFLKHLWNGKCFEKTFFFHFNNIFLESDAFDGLDDVIKFIATNGQ